MTLQLASRGLTQNERRALLQWLTQQGPFWDDMRNHAPDDWLEFNSLIVTDTSLGEAGWCCGSGIERGLVSFVPSNWQFTPILVDWLSEEKPSQTIPISNYWDAGTLEGFLRLAPPPLTSWDQLDDLATVRFGQITFSPDTFEPLHGLPFVSAAAQRLVVVLDILNRFKGCFDEKGRRTKEGHHIYQNFFTGKKGDGGRGALFSRSSEEKKRRFFKSEMTFKDPSNAARRMFCPRPGNSHPPRLRVHFSYPIKNKNSQTIRCLHWSKDYQTIANPRETIS